MLSIITVNYNNFTGLLKTVNSVLCQNCKEWEYQIVDAKSSDFDDGYFSFLKDKGIRILSESDKGVYDGMNKGASLTKENYLLFLNSGDALFNSAVFNIVNPYFGKYDLVYGNYPPKLSVEYMMVYGLPHQGIFINRYLHETIGGYSLRYKIISDWVFFMEALFYHDATYVHVDNVVSVFDGHGISQKDENVLLIITEHIDYISKRFPNYLKFYKLNSPYVKKYFRRIPRWKRIWKKFLFLNFNKI